MVRGGVLSGAVLSTTRYSSAPPVLSLRFFFFFISVGVSVFLGVLWWIWVWIFVSWLGFLFLGDFMVDFVSLVLLHVGWGVTGSVFLVVLWGDMFCLLVLRWGWSWWSDLSWGGGDCDRFELSL